MLFKFLKVSILGVVSLSTVRMKKKDTYNQKGEMIDGGSMRRYFTVDSYPLNTYSERVFEINLPFIDRKIFFAFPWTDVISVPKTMMDGSSDLCGHVTSHRIEGVLDMKYKVVNPVKFLKNRPIYSMYNPVCKKITLLEELFSNGEPPIYNEDITSIILRWNTRNKILKKRQERLKDIINNIETSEFDEFDSCQLEVELRDVIRNEYKILNPSNDGDEYGIVYIPRYDNIKAWFKNELDQYRKNKHLKYFESIKEKETNKILYIGSLSILIWNFIYGKNEEKNEDFDFFNDEDD